MQRETINENSKCDSVYYVIPQLNKVVPFHGGHHTASKLLADAGYVNILAEDLLQATEKQVSLFFPTFDKVWIEREVTRLPKRENKIPLLTPLQIACRRIAKDF